MLDSRQRAYLRALANPLDALFQVGKGNLTEAACVQFDDALTARELIKVSILRSASEDARSIAESAAEAVGADVVSLVGRRFVLYRASEKLRKEGRSIRLPR
jgi:RNA-binding protein